MIRELNVFTTFGEIHIRQNEKGKWIVNGECSVYEGLPELFEAAQSSTEGKLEQERRRTIFPALEDKNHEGL